MSDDQIPDGYTELREVYQFATAFMHALIQREVDFYMVDTKARLAYQQADAMLAAREKKGGR